MKTRHLLPRLLKALGFLVLLAAFYLVTVIFLWEDHHENHIVRGGPFEQQFDGGPLSWGIYPPRPDQIEAWFESTLPAGTHIDDARRILDKSFSVDLTSGDFENIEVTQELVGGSYTKVRLSFDANGWFQSVEVKQHWAYL